MKKRLAWGGGVVAIIMVIGASVWNSMGAPFYQPGMVRAGTGVGASLTPPEQGPDASFWRVEKGIELYHESEGTGRAVLVVHGGPGFPYSDSWQGLDSLEDAFTFHYYHQRGCGKSTKPFDQFEATNFYANLKELESGLGLGVQVADLERIRRILGEEKLILIGHSYGGFIASLYAAEFPEHVDALILVAPADLLKLPSEAGDLFAKARDCLPEEEWAAFDRVRDQLFDFGNLFNRNESEWAAIQRESGEFLLTAMGEDSESILAEGNEANGGWMPMATYVSMGKSHDYRAAFAEIEVPVLILQGADDLLTLSGSQSFAAVFPQAELEVLSCSEPGERAGHFVFNDIPESFSGRVRKFLDRLR